VATGTGGYGM